MADSELDLYKQIGARIREARASLNMSQADLADKAHLSLPHVSVIELGKTKMQLSTFISIVEALQISADSILRADNPESKNVYSTEISNLLSDCSPAEMESILRIITELKHTMRIGKENANH